ncbi:uncharacterized protein [Arachis hypogaea]|uniref:uncharacterized protein isoform X1 n=1 Tax=Arachis hypogaea TaxID=3818 RepID=UPI003B217294
MLLDCMENLVSQKQLDPFLIPILSNATPGQLSTALVITGNIEFVDDILTFEELGHFLKSHGCHVAKLSSVDFSMKNGIAGCLKALLREFPLGEFIAYVKLENIAKFDCWICFAKCSIQICTHIEILFVTSGMKKIKGCLQQMATVNNTLPFKAVV